MNVSDNPFCPKDWNQVKDFKFNDITYHKAKKQGTVRIAFNRPKKRNAFRPQTVDELYQALDHARQTYDVGTVILTGNGPSPKDGGWAFCSGGDQSVRGQSGYQYSNSKDSNKDNSTGSAGSAGSTGPTQPAGSTEPTQPAGPVGRLHILEVQRLIRFMPKVVVCVVPGWAAGGGHSLHVICDLTLASKEHAVFKQTDANVASFDGGYGSAYLAKMVGQKKAREIFYLGRDYSATQAKEMGMVNEVFPHKDLEKEALAWCREINSKSPTAIRMLKFAFNLVDDGLAGQQVFAGEATRLAYSTEEAREGRNAFLEKRDQNYTKFPYHY